MNNKWPWFSYGIACLAVSVAVCVGIYITHSAWCLWAFLLLPEIHTRSKNDGNRESIDDNNEEVND